MAMTHEMAWCGVSRVGGSGVGSAPDQVCKVLLHSRSATRGTDETAKAL